MTVLWGRETEKDVCGGNGENRDNRRSFDFAQDDTSLVMGMGMRHRWLTADSSAALRNDKQKYSGMTNKSSKSTVDKQSTAE
jgi:hypothetical protein